ncbi:VF_A0006 family four-cysteine protein [Bradyrhizobium sp. UFLA05-109]
MSFIMLATRGLVRGKAGALLALVSSVVAAAALVSSSGSVVAQTDMEKQAQCELSFIRDTRSPLAIQYIRSACNWLALNGDSLLNERSKGYYACLVQQLSGAQANEAAAAIISACRTSNPL